MHKVLTNKNIMDTSCYNVNIDKNLGDNTTTSDLSGYKTSARNLLLLIPDTSVGVATHGSSQNQTTSHSKYEQSTGCIKADIIAKSSGLDLS